MLWRRERECDTPVVGVVGISDAKDINVPWPLKYPHEGTVCGILGTIMELARAMKAESTFMSSVYILTRLNCISLYSGIDN